MVILLASELAGNEATEGSNASNSCKEESRTTSYGEGIHLYISFLMPFYDLLRSSARRVGLFHVPVLSFR